MWQEPERPGAGLGPRASSTNENQYASEQRQDRHHHGGKAESKKSSKPDENQIDSEEQHPDTTR
jgi:hypothetical protein